MPFIPHRVLLALHNHVRAEKVNQKLGVYHVAVRLLLVLQVVPRVRFLRFERV